MKKLFLFFALLTATFSFSQYEVQLYSFDRYPHIRNESYDWIVVCQSIDSSRHMGADTYWGEVKTLRREYLKISADQVIGLETSLDSKINSGDISSWAKQASKPNYSYSELSGTPTIPTNTNQLTNGAGFITSVPAQSWTSITGKPSFATVSTTGDYADLTNKPTVNSTVSRSLNNNFTISTTKQAKVSYTVRISYSITALLGSTGTVDLQYSTNAGSTWITVSTVSNNLNLGLTLSGYNDFTLYGEIPANALVRLNSTTSNATNTYRTGQETY